MDVLKQIYASVMSSTPLEGSLSQHMELFQNTQLLHRDYILLQLSTIRQLYTKTSSNRQIRLCNILLQEGVTQYLVTMLENDDQFITFSASKALVMVLISQECSVEVIKSTVEKLVNCLENCHERQLLQHSSVYCLQTLTEVLRKLRKFNTTEDKMQAEIERKWRSGIECLVSYWLKITDCVKETANLISVQNCPKQIILQFLFLCLEGLRAKEESILKIVLDTIEQITELVKSTSCLICLTKLYDIFRKCLDVETESISLQTSLLTYKCFFSVDTAVIVKVLGEWFDRESEIVFKMFALEFDLMLKNQTSIKDVSTQVMDLDTGVKDTLLRKFFILSLMVVTSTQEYTEGPKESSMCNSWQLLSVFFKTLQTSILHHYLLPDKYVKLFVQRLVLHLVTEEDSCLVDTLSKCLKIQTVKLEALFPLSKTVEIHSLFVQFLSSISFDCSMLVDFVISNETDFDHFLVDYFQSLLHDSGKERFKSACQGRDAMKKKEKVAERSKGDAKKEVEIAIMPDSRKRKFSGNQSSCRKCTIIDSSIKKDINLGLEYDSSSSSESESERTIEDEITTLESVIDTYKGLHSSLQKTHRKKLIQEEKLSVIVAIIHCIDLLFQPSFFAK